ncbi:MAG: signal peptidase I [Acidimicrobiales bacterium]
MVTEELPEASTSPPGPGARSSRSVGRWMLEWAVILLLVVGFTLGLRTYVIQTFSIPSGSMLPTLHIGDRIIVNKLAYDFHPIHRGDIVVFRRPPLEKQNFADLVKRVVGLPGETISASGGHIYINGKLLSEPWLPKGPQSYTGPLPGDPHPQFNMPGPVKIPAGEYYVMGDNRVNSEDSRYFGPIPKSLIVGQAFVVVWPLSQIKGL